MNDLNHNTCLIVLRLIRILEEKNLGGNLGSLVSIALSSGIRTECKQVPATGALSLQLSSHCFLVLHLQGSKGGFAGCDGDKHQSDPSLTLTPSESDTRRKRLTD